MRVAFPQIPQLVLVLLVVVVRCAGESREFALRPARAAAHSALLLKNNDYSLSALESSDEFRIQCREQPVL